MNIYVQLTHEFNAGRMRTILSSGQAVVLHQLAIMSKDGDWILREDNEALTHVLAVLSSHGAHYRFGAPLDIRWMMNGWSSHFEFMQNGLRIRTDFVTRPPRISLARLEQIWTEQQTRELPFVDMADLAELKKTNREKDYAVIGELTRMMITIEDQLRYSRSAREIIELSDKHPAVAMAIAVERPVITAAAQGIERLEVKLDAERRYLMHTNEKRLALYQSASEPWAELWPDLERKTASLPLVEAHQIITSQARQILPFTPDPGVLNHD